MSQDNEQNQLVAMISQARPDHLRLATDITRNILRSLEIHPADQAVDIAGEKLMYLLTLLEQSQNPPTNK